VAEGTGKGKRKGAVCVASLWHGLGLNCQRSSPHTSIDQLIPQLPQTHRTRRSQLYVGSSANSVTVRGS